MFRIGHSFDLHTLVEGRKLILGGIEIEHDKGLLGHSDADCLLHAITESLIGAMAKGDIGTFFPDDDPKYKSIDSMILLREVNQLLQEEGYTINNIDAIIYAQRPKIKPHVGEMRKKIAQELNIDENQINIKATTGEKVGVIGKEEAIGAESVVLLSKGEKC